MNEKGFANIILILIIVVLASAGVYFVLNRQTTPLASIQTFKKLDFSQFDKLCVYNEQYRGYQCQQPLSKFSCGIFLKPSEHFAWLEPLLPIMICNKGGEAGKVSQEGVYRIEEETFGGPRVSATDYVVFLNGEFKLISSTDEFKSIFAPVQTREEALAFVEALNKGNLVFDTQQLMHLEGGKYKVSKSTINKTSASETTGGFIVNIYTDFGQCIRRIYKKNLLVKTSGDIEERDSTLIWGSDSPKCVY